MKAVIFDMDGVLIDSEREYINVLISFFNEYDKEVTFSQAATLIGTSNKEGFALMHAWFNEGTLEEFVQKYLDYHSQISIHYPSILKKGVVSTLQTLKDNNIPMGLASSSPIDNIQTVLETCELNQFFDIVVSGEQFVESKPNPEIYHYAASKLGFNAEDCLVVEDSYPGILAGKRAGATVIAIRDEAFDIDQSLADHIVDEISHVLAKLS